VTHTNLEKGINDILQHKIGQNKFRIKAKDNKRGELSATPLYD